MAEIFSFETRVEPMVWGSATYTILPLPLDVAAALECIGAKRAEGELNDHPINLALTKAPATQHTFLWAGKSLLRDCHINPGDVIDVRLRKADPSLVEIPDDVAAALRAHGMTDAWSGQSAGQQRGQLHKITSARQQDTRDKRIAALIESLRS